MTESLLERVKTYLLRREYGPEDKIDTEYEMAERMGVSRASIREAVVTLCQQGLLERRPRVGTRILPFDARSAAKDLAFRFRIAGFEEADAAEARQAIELAVLPLAIQRITPVAIERLNDCVVRMESLKDKPSEADQADRDFHLTLLEACGNKTLQAFGGVIEWLFRDSFQEKYWNKKMMKRAVTEHRELLKAIVNKETSAAMEILQKHLEPRW